MGAQYLISKTVPNKSCLELKLVLKKISGHIVWCILYRTTAIPHMVHQGDALAHYVHVILLIWNISTCTTEVMCVNKVGKIHDVM